MKKSNIVFKKVKYPKEKVRSYEEKTQILNSNTERKKFSSVKTISNTLKFNTGNT